MMRGQLLERSEGINEVLKKRNAGFAVVYTSVVKNNRIMEGYNLVKENEAICPVVYYGESWWSESDEKVADYLMNYEKRADAPSVNITKYYNSEYILSHVYPRVYGRRNMDNFDQFDRFYTEYLDMLVGYYVLIDELCTDTEIASMPLTNADLERMHISKEAVEREAIRHICEEAEINTLISMIPDANVLGIRFQDECKMYVVSNKRQINGAAAILSRKVQEKMAELIGDSYYVLPSSIHEVICCPFNDAEELKNMVCQVNNDVVMLDDKLTDSVYRYENGVLDLVD